MIRIVSKRDGFRRCGIEHPAAPTLYPNDRFTSDEVARLKAEPMLVVEEMPDEPIQGKGRKAESDKKAGAEKKDE